MQNKYMQKPTNQLEVLNTINSINQLIAKHNKQDDVILLTEKFSYLKALIKLIKLKLLNFNNEDLEE